MYHKRGNRVKRLSCPGKVESGCQKVCERFDVCVSADPKIPPWEEVRIITEALALCDILEFRVCAKVRDTQDSTNVMLLCE
jgi:hypothetical protein